MRTMIVTHPNNRKILRSLSFEEGVGPLPAAIDPLYGTEIKFDPMIPERDTRQDWHPPEGDRFCDYGPEDEAWMRPLGLGRLETVDLGPLFYEVAEPAFRTFATSPVYLPRPYVLSTLLGAGQ